MTAGHRYLQSEVGSGKNEFRVSQVENQESKYGLRVQWIREVAEIRWGWEGIIGLVAVKEGDVVCKSW